MKVAVKKVNELQRELQIEVPKERVEDTFNDVYAEIKKSAKIAGFRPGTAPRHILEKHHSGLAREEVIKHLLPLTYREAIEKEKFDTLSLPEVTDVKLDGVNGLSYKAKIEIRPTIEVKNYKKIKIKKRSNEVTDEDLDKALDSLKKMRKVDVIDENFAHGLGYASMDEFNNALKRQLGAQKESENKMQFEREVIDHLFKNSKFTTPESLVNRRYNELQRDLKNYLEQSRLPKEEIEKKEKEFDPKLKDQAQEQVKVFLVLDEIAKRENITRDDHMPNQVMEFLFKNAEWV